MSWRGVRPVSRETARRRRRPRRVQVGEDPGAEGGLPQLAPAHDAHRGGVGRNEGERILGPPDGEEVRRAEHEKSRGPRRDATAGESEAGSASWSEVLSGKEPGGEGERGDAEERRRAENGEVIRSRPSVRELRPRPRGRPWPGRAPPSWAAPSTARRRCARRFPSRRPPRSVVADEDRGEEENGVRPHERNRRRGRDDADEEREGHQRRDREENHGARKGGNGDGRHASSTR